MRFRAVGVEKEKEGKRVGDEVTFGGGGGALRVDDAGVAKGLEELI